MDKPDVDFIEGLSPAVSIDQKSTSKNPRSTVGTITEVYDYLRLLYARAGRPHCPVCGAPIERQTPQQIVDRVLALEEGRRFQVLAPVIRGRKGEYVELFRQLQTDGFSRVRVNGETHTLDDPPKLDKQKKHTIEVVVDRLAVKASSKRRLTDSVETALRLANGLVVLDFVDLPVKDPGRELKFSEKMSCPNDHTIDTDELEPRSFSFNSPFGACPECHGLGTRMEVDPDLVVPDAAGDARRGRDPALEPGPRRRLLPAPDGGARARSSASTSTPRGTSCPPRRASPLLDGHPTKVHVVTTNRYGRQRAYYAEFEGVRSYVERRHGEAESDTSRERFEGFMREVPCPACHGQPAQAGQPGGDDGRQVDRRGVRPADQRDGRLPRPTSSCPRARSRSPSGCSRRSRSGSTSCSTSGSTTSPSTGRAARCRVARRSGSGWPPRSAPAWSASSTSSTSRRSGSTSATTSG